MTDLDKLIAAVETGGMIAWGLGGSPSRKALPTHWHDAMNAYLGSLDGAHRLHEALLPGWAVENLGNAVIDGTGGWNVRLVAPDYLETFAHSTANAATPARAWLLAILRALKAQGETS